MSGAALTTASELDTPLGRLPVDTAGVATLTATGAFSAFPLPADEAEHCVEMHLPLLAAACGSGVPVLPIVVGATSAATEAALASALAPLVAEPGTLFALSSDFCHWGARFRFQGQPTGLPAGTPLADGIRALDEAGMASIASGSAQVFREYLEATKNTICGRHAICVFLELAAAAGWRLQVAWEGYAQSSTVVSADDSSVSYASGVLCRQQAPPSAPPPA